MDATTVSIATLVMNAPTGADFEASLEAAQVETYDPSALADFLKGAGTVAKALADIHRPSAISYIEWTRILKEAIQTRNYEAARISKSRLAAILGGLNGTWETFRTRCLFTSSNVARAQVQRTLASVSGEIIARPPRPEPQLSLTPQQKKLAFFIAQLRDTAPQTFGRYKVALDNPEPQAFFENLADVLLELVRISTRDLDRLQEYELRQIVEMEFFVRGVKTLMAQAAFNSLRELGRLVKRLRQSWFEKPSELFYFLDKRIRLAKEKLSED